jgi:hypothetical protein
MVGVGTEIVGVSTTLALVVTLVFGVAVALSCGLLLVCDVGVFILVQPAPTARIRPAVMNG